MALWAKYFGIIEYQHSYETLQLVNTGNIHNIHHKTPVYTKRVVTTNGKPIEDNMSSVYNQKR